jgi:hypothetical protein
MEQGTGKHSVFIDFAHWLMLKIIKKERLPSGMSLGAIALPEK